MIVLRKSFTLQWVYSLQIEIYGAVKFVFYFSAFVKNFTPSRQTKGFQLTVILFERIIMSTEARAAIRQIAIFVDVETMETFWQSSNTTSDPDKVRKLLNGDCSFDRCRL